MSAYSVATVIAVVNEKPVMVEGQTFYIQTVRVRENRTAQTFDITSGSEFQPLNENQRLKVGAQVIISPQTGLSPVDLSQGDQASVLAPPYIINDVYRLPVIGSLAVLFGVLVILVAGRRGTLSIVGMFLSLFILISFIVPRILAGDSPLLVTIGGASLTAVISMYLSHGFKRQVHIALGSMIMCLLVVAGLSAIAVRAGQFVGLGSEEAAYLQFGQAQHINLQGLLLAGILLGALGILDDITLAQTSVVEQLKAVHPKITFDELYWRSLSVGKDHVASLVNTLVFAYAGTSLPLFLLFTLYRTDPTWVVLNSQVIAEELVRTLVGSIGLVLAVPITTLIASYDASRGVRKAASTAPHHQH